MKQLLMNLVISGIALCVCVSCSDDSSEKLPSSLPFHVPREATGTALTQTEIDDTTSDIVSLWTDSDYFNWVVATSHGMAPDNEWDYPDYSLWWQNTVAVKEGDVVTFRHTGGADNIMLRTARVLQYCLAGYHVSGDARLRRISLDYIKGVRALFTCMRWENEQPPVDTIMARGFFNHNHNYTLDDGRKVAIDYSPVKYEDIARRHDTLHNPGNPTWGDIWVRTKRSKDDLPFLFRLVPLMMRVQQDSSDKELVAEITDTLEYIRGFARDIVEHDYSIRSKDGDGKPFIPMYGENKDDFACFNFYDNFWPDCECTAKLNCDLIAHPEQEAHACDTGIHEDYEAMVRAAHYWSLAIIRYFHVSAAALALIEGRNDAAESLVQGLALRASTIMSDTAEREKISEWDADAATYLIAAAAYGLALTADEARLVARELRRTAAHYRGFAYWNLWDASVPDGEYEYIPGRETTGDVPDGQTKVLRPIELAAVLEYCESPFKDPASEPFIDCSVVLDPSRWAE